MCCFAGLIAYRILKNQGESHPFRSGSESTRLSNVAVVVIESGKHGPYQRFSAFKAIFRRHLLGQPCLVALDVRAQEHSELRLP